MVREVRAGRAYVEIVAKDTRLQAGLRRASKRLQSFAQSVRAVGGSLFAGGLVATSPFGLSARTFATFEQQMARVQALTGATGDDFARLEAKARKMGESTVFSASQAAEAMSFFALAGFEVDDILSALGPTLALAAAGQIGIAEAADIAAKIMSGMGIAAEDLGGAIDVLAKAMTTANTDLTMLGNAFKFVGPIAKSAGISFEEITAAIQLLSNAGVQGEMAGTTLRGMILSLTSPTAEAKKQLDALGVAILDTSGNVRPLADILSDLERGLAGLGAGQRLAILGSIFPDRQAAGAAELVAQGADRLREATQALQDSAGTAGRISETQLNTLTGDFTILMSVVESVQIAIGKALGGALRVVVSSVSKILSSIGQWIEQNQAVVLTIAAIAVGVTGLGATLLGAGIAFSVIAAAMSGLATVAGVVTSALAAIATPAGAVIAVLGGLAAGILTASGVGSEALRWLGDQFAGLRDRASQTWAAMSKAMAAGDMDLAVKVLWAAIRAEWQRGLNVLTGWWTDFKFGFLRIWDEAVFGFSKLINDAWAGAEATWVETIDFLADTWSVFTNMLTKTWNSTVGFIRKAWVRLKSLFDSDINIDAEIERINRETAAKNQRSDEATIDAVGARDAARRTRQQQIEQDRAGRIDQLQQMQDQVRQDRESQQETQIAAAEAELQRATEAWRAAIAEANQVPAAEAADKAGKSLKDRLAALQGSLLEPGGVVEREAAKVESKGTFNATALLGLGSDSVATRTAKASEQVAENTRQLVQEAKRGKLVFGA